MSELQKCPWCAKRFETLSARYHHARASHSRAPIEVVEFDVIDSRQVARHGNLQPIAAVVRPIVERITK